jgi:glycosyltransferase involved in cell wall biosynthesis
MEGSRKKVLFIITKSTLGGAQRYVYDLARELPSDAFDVEVAVGGDGPLTEMLKEAGIKVHTLSSLKRDVSLLRDLHALFLLIRILKKVKPDVLHLNSSKASALGALAGRLCRVPRIIFTAHGWAFNEDRPVWQKNVFKFVHWITILLSHMTIAVSEGMRSEMTLPFTKRKMVVVHLGRSIANMRYREDARGMLEMKVTDTRARLIDYHDDFWLGTIAELHPIKRLNRAITAVSVLVKEFPGLRFVIVHDGSERENLTEQVRDLGLEEHVFFTGTVEEAARLLPAFDLFVLPSKSEAFGYVLIEAGLAGVPVVATRVGGIPDIITSEENGLLVPPDNTPALTEALRRMIADEELRLKLARAHQDKARTFTLEKMVAETQRVYEI